MLLGELKNPVDELPGIGKASAASLAGVGIRSIGDLLKYLPRDYEDRRNEVPFRSIEYEGNANTTIHVVEHQYFYWRGRQTLKVIVTDDSEPATLLCYGRNFLASTLIPGEEFRLFGRFQRRRGDLQSSSFSVERTDRLSAEFGKILPVYSLTGRLTQKLLRSAVAASLKLYSHDLEEELPSQIIESRRLLRFRDAIERLHFGTSVEESKAARRTLAFGELFYLQLIMQRRVRARRVRRKRDRDIDHSLFEKTVKRLPFQLTIDQLRSLDQIHDDLQKPTAMMRLLQGDVGSGKTLVALLSAVDVASGGGQTALMAPTELLARQHANTAAALLEPVGIRVALLTGGITGASRASTLGAIRAGEVDLIVGTHALFSHDVAFKSLSLVIVDEQHRFGVMQRLAIVEKGNAPDLLLMTATPIPRSLALTVFGDLDTSTIKSMPHGRLPIRTHLALRGKEEKVYHRVRQELEAGRQAYFVYPLISQSEFLEVKDAESMYEELRMKVFPNHRLALIHSRVSEEDKRIRMMEFIRGEAEVLVATSVVEVGVDVPNATCMVIEHAERFGLAALHQLRGRVGRSTTQSYAYLIYDSDITEIAKRRIMAIKNSSDGFEIAEEDLKMRGPGELTGTHQTGALEFRFADIVDDFDLLSSSREDVMNILADDPKLLLPDHQAIRSLLSRCPPYSNETASAG